MSHLVLGGIKLNGQLMSEREQLLFVVYIFMLPLCAYVGKCDAV